MVCFYKHLPPQRGASPGSSRSPGQAALGTPPRWLPGAASRCAILPASPKICCQILLCPSELQLREVNFGTQSSVFIRNHELKELLSLEIENLISQGVLQRSQIVVRGRREHLCSIAVYLSKTSKGNL